MKLAFPWRIRGRAAFSLLEVLIATSVLVLILVLVLSMIDSAGRLVGQTTRGMATFREARAAFEAMTRNLSQAVLNTYWDYDPPVGTGMPQRYVRESELHFVAGKAHAGSGSNLLNASGLDTVSHAIFFVAPLGLRSPPATGSSPRLQNLLNACGYFVEFGSDAGLRPAFLAGIVPERHRFRLKEMVQPSEELSIYRNLEQFKSGGSPSLLYDWFVDPLKSADRPSHRLADNVIALVIRSRRSPQAATTTPPLAPDYAYDSRRHLTTTDPRAELTRNQLPPVLEITMVAIDEASAARLEGNSTTMPVIPVGGGKSFAQLFGNEAEFEDDLQDLEAGLTQAGIGYHVFKGSVPILQAKWSEN